jgi:hypothetical protein
MRCLFDGQQNVWPITQLGCVFDVQFRCAVLLRSFKVRFDVRFDVTLKRSMCKKLTSGKT